MTEFELELARFCKDLQAALASKDKPEWFKSDCGLCENIYQWAGGGHNHREAQTLQNRLSGLFMDEFGGSQFPFESGADHGARWWNYNDDAINDRLYSNPRRLAFIAKWAALAP